MWTSPEIVVLLSQSSPIHPEDRRGASVSSKQSSINQLWTMAVTFGGFAIVMMTMVTLLGDLDIVQRVMLYLMLATTLFGFAATLVMIYKLGREEDEPETSTGPYRCKHCGARFSGKSVWRIHERSCVEMKVW